MENILIQFTTVFMGFFAIMNPIANVPIFLGLTAEDDNETTMAIAIKSLLLAFFIVSLFSIAGKTIFELFGLTIYAFQIAGGILVFLIGFHMLQGNHSAIQHPSEKHKESSKEAALSVAVSPLAMPILAGPGTLTTAMNFSASSGYRGLIITISAFATLCIITYILFIFGKKFVQYIGESALGVITRMMGIIITVIGTQMLIDGIRSAIKG